MHFETIIYYLLIFFPFFGILLSYVFSVVQIKIPKAAIVLCTGIIFFWFYGFSIHNKQVEFAILYISFLVVIIFIWKQFSKINLGVNVVLITAYFSVLGLGGMFWIWVIGDYVSPTTHKVLKDNYFLVMKGTGNFSHSEVKCTLSRELFGKYLALNINSTSFPSVGLNEILITENPDKSIRLKSRNTSVIFKKSQIWIVLFYIFLIAWITSLVMTTLIESENAKIQTKDYEKIL